MQALSDKFVIFV